MDSFLQQHESSVTGMLSGWDRIRFRGTLRLLACAKGLGQFLSGVGCRFKDFKHYALGVSKQVREASLAVAESAQRPVQHLNGPSISKEQRARDLEQRDGIEQGLIGVLTAVEPCWSYNIKSEQSGEGQKRLRLVSDYRKCQHLYHYQIHPIFGRMHVRLQTWLPFSVHICINGREWLARQMDAEGLGYTREENCFRSLENPQRAQALADLQQRDGVATDVGERVARILSQPPGDLSSGGPILLLECQGKRILQRRALCLPAGFGQGLSKLGALRDRTLR